MTVDSELKLDDLNYIANAITLLYARDYIGDEMFRDLIFRCHTEMKEVLDEEDRLVNQPNTDG